MRHPPAWYPDPTGLHDHRWWDGVEWTAHVADAGTATLDPLPATPGGVGPAGAADPARDATGRTAGTGSGTGASTPGVAVTALVLGIVALLLGWVPFLGAVLGLGALVLAVVAVRRTRDRPGRGLATGGVLTAALGLTTGVATTVLALLVLVPGAGGGFGAIGREYLACMETRPAEVCEQRLADDVTALLGG